MSTPEATGPDKITPPSGAETYTDVLGRTQWRVIGPSGRLLITREAGRDWQVWRPNSLTTVYRDRELQRALDIAYRRVNPEATGPEA